MRRVCFLIVLILLALRTAESASAQPSPYTILAIGDSITAGTEGPSYLCPLKQKLPQATFVGPPDHSTNCATPHAGYGGYTSQKILSYAEEWIPFVNGATVVIHIGTNDVYSEFDLDRITIPNIRQIIQKVKDAKAQTIILAQIIPSRDDPMTGINSRLAALAQETGVRLVNAGNCFTTGTDMVDSVHPNDHGAEVIAANIAASVSGSSPPACTTPTPGVAAGTQQPSGTGGTQSPTAWIDVTPDLSAGQSMSLGGLPLYFPGLAPVAGQAISSLIRFAEKQHVVPAFLKSMGITLDLTAANDLMPSTLKKQLSRPYENGKNPVLPFSTAWRLCLQGAEIFDVNGEKREGDIPLTGYNKSEQGDGQGTGEYIGAGDPDDPNYMHKALWSAVYLGATMANGKIPGLNFQYMNNALPVQIPGSQPCFGDVCHNTDTKAFDQILAPCNAGYSGRGNRVIPNEARGVTRTGKDSGTSLVNVNYLRDTVVNLFGVLEPCGSSDAETPPKKECKKAPVSVTPTDFFAGACTLASSLIGTGGDLGIFCPLANAAGKEAIKKIGGGGAWNSLWPASLPDFRRTNAVVPQKQALGESDSSGQPRLAVFAQAEGIREADACIRYNAVVPAAVKRERGYRCSLTEGEPYPGSPDRPIASWSVAPLGSDFATSGWNGSVQDAIRQATDGRIPTCVLEAVKYIETGDQSDFSGQCSINECSATGPFQITVGVVADGGGGWTNYCSQCGKGKQCPNNWPGEWPVNPSDPNPCDVAASAKQAVDILQAKAEYWTPEFFGSTQTLTPAASVEELRAQQDTIIVAANSYFGSGQAKASFGGCSYGEFVYKHCDGSYSCSGNGKYLFPHERP